MSEMSKLYSLLTTICSSKHTLLHPLITAHSPFQLLLRLVHLLLEELQLLELLILPLLAFMLPPFLDQSTALPLPLYLLLDQHSKSSMQLDPSFTKLTFLLELLTSTLPTASPRTTLNQAALTSTFMPTLIDLLLITLSALTTSTLEMLEHTLADTLPLDLSTFKLFPLCLDSTPFKSVTMETSPSPPSFALTEDSDLTAKLPHSMHLLFLLEIK